MASVGSDKISAIINQLRTALVGPQTLVFLPALTLGGYWFGGEGMLLFFALVFPAAFAIAGLFSGTGPAWQSAKDRETDLPLRPSAERALKDMLQPEKYTGKTTAALAVSLDEFPSLVQQYGSGAANSILKRTADRLTSALRDNDMLVRLDGPRFGIILGPVAHIDLEVLIQLSARLQATIADPYSVDAARIFTSGSVGFCLPDTRTNLAGVTILDLAEAALEVATANGNGSIRAYSADICQNQSVQTDLHTEVSEALENGQIRPWFQPQVSTNTGEITGFEALARWEHPSRGLIPPIDFLPVMRDMKLLERLGQVVMKHSLAALRQWDKAGFSIPNVAVNFSGDELSNPKLCDRILWELDRFELGTERLCVEILEDVIAVSGDEMIIQNIQKLAEMGCYVDLDDFGTGHASIANIRRFSVNRIKIDRSFITRIDRDREQQNMVAAILTMAERLNIDTLAEGVETVGEHALLAQLGCGHVQGFSIARPMPFEDTEKWIAQYCEKLPAPPDVGRIAS